MSDEVLKFLLKAVAKGDLKPEDAVPLVKEAAGERVVYVDRYVPNPALPLTPNWPHWPHWPQEPWVRPWWTSGDPPPSFTVTTSDNGLIAGAITHPC